jgi:hypothetical protein
MLDLDSAQCLDPEGWIRIQQNVWIRKAGSGRLDPDSAKYLDQEGWILIQQNAGSGRLNRIQQNVWIWFSKKAGSGLGKISGSGRLVPNSAKRLDPDSEKWLNPDSAKCLNPDSAQSLDPDSAKSLHLDSAKSLDRMHTLTEIVKKIIEKSLIWKAKNSPASHVTKAGIVLLCLHRAQFMEHC